MKPPKIRQSYSMYGRYRHVMKKRVFTDSNYEWCEIKFGIIIVKGLIVHNPNHSFTFYHAYCIVNFSYEEYSDIEIFFLLKSEHEILFDKILKLYNLCLTPNNMLKA
jgi:hypothetical protein